MRVDYWGEEGKGYVCPLSQIIRGAGAALPPPPASPSSYAYDLKHSLTWMTCSGKIANEISPAE